MITREKDGSDGDVEGVEGEQGRFEEDRRLGYEVQHGRRAQAQYGCPAHRRQLHTQHLQQSIVTQGLWVTGLADLPALPEGGGGLGNEVFPERRGLAQDKAGAQEDGDAPQPPYLQMEHIYFPAQFPLLALWAYREAQGTRYVGRELSEQVKEAVQRRPAAGDAYEEAEAGQEPRDEDGEREAQGEGAQRQPARGSGRVALVHGLTSACIHSQSSISPSGDEGGDRGAGGR